MRAYLGIESAKMTSEEGNPHRQAIQIALKNYGQTPANKIIYWINVCAAERKGIPVLPASEKRHGIGVISPSASMTVVVPMTLIDGGDEIYIGEKALYIYGQFAYVDSFGHRRVTDFRRYRYGPNWTRDGDLEATIEGNEAT